MAMPTELDDVDPSAPSWIAELLQLTREGDTFVAASPTGPNVRLFGGLIAAQALAAGCATVSADKQPQSLHAYFVRAGRPEVDVAFEVERTRDGRSFDTRRVTATQDGRVILEVLASFHLPEPGFADWQPESTTDLPLDATVAADLPDDLGGRFEMRAARPAQDGFVGPPYWIRTRRPVEDDPVMRAGALTYISDMGLMAAARPPGIPLQRARQPGVAASLDHAVWFHRPFHPDRWHRYEASPLNANDARGLALGALRSEDGTLVATMTQEALWRV